MCQSHFSQAKSKKKNDNYSINCAELGGDYPYKCSWQLSRMKHTTHLLLCWLLECINVSWVQPTFFSPWYVTPLGIEGGVWSTSLWRPYADFNSWLPIGMYYLIITSLPGLQVQWSLSALDPNLCLPPDWSSVGQLLWLSSTGSNQHFLLWNLFFYHRMRIWSALHSVLKKIPSNIGDPTEILWAIF